MNEHPLRTWRIDRRMTLKTASERFGLSQAQLSAIERRKHKTSAEHAATIMRETGLSIEQVLGQ